MKKGLLAVVAMLLLSGNAFAAFPVVDWSSPAFFATDPQEAGISLNYNMKALYGVFQGGGLTGDLALKTDVFGVATLLREDNAWSTNASYSWNLDLDGDLSPDVIAILTKDRSTGIDSFKINGGADLGTNFWQLSGDNAQVIIPSSYFGVVDPNKFGVYAILDGASIAPDDRLPDSGWTTTVPEPMSMAMLGLGLLGLVGKSFKKRFVA